MRMLCSGYFIETCLHRCVGDRLQLAGCAGAGFAMAAIAQLNPDSFVTNNECQMQHTRMHFLLDLASNMTNAYLRKR
jgi:hypothetical protein